MEQLNIKIKKILFRETSNSNLVGVIALFMIFASFLWNSNSKWLDLKSNIMESIKSPKITANLSLEKEKIILSIWKQTVLINWEEFVIDITRKF